MRIAALALALAAACGPSPRPVDPAPAARQPGFVAAFAHDALPASLPLRVRPRASRVVVEPEYRYTVGATRITLDATFRIAVRGAAVDRLAVGLDGWTVDEAGPATLVDAASIGAAEGTVVLPFLHRMGLAWGAAEVALTRAGANSVAEAEINGVPCLFVPYPYHRDLHQRENARELVEAGAAAIALDAIEPEANMQVMGRLLESLVTDGPARDRMAAALAAQPRVDAAEQIARRLAERARGR